jgi:hypothetical protein
MHTLTRKPDRRRTPTKLMVHFRGRFLSKCLEKLLFLQGLGKRATVLSGRRNPTLRDTAGLAYGMKYVPSL